MECDSVHRSIEQQMKKQDVNIPDDYVNVVKRTRMNPRPYEVRFDQILPHSFFLNYEAVNDVPTIRPGYRVHDPTVNRKLTEAIEPKYAPLYTKPREIPLSKYQHLQELKKTIPNFFNSYYDLLAHKPEKKKPSEKLKKNKENKDDQLPDAPPPRTKRPRKKQQNQEENKDEQLPHAPPPETKKPKKKPQIQKKGNEAEGSKQTKQKTERKKKKK